MQVTIEIFNQKCAAFPFPKNSTFMKGNQNEVQILIPVFESNQSVKINESLMSIYKICDSFPIIFKLLNDRPTRPSIRYHIFVIF